MHIPHLLVHIMAHCSERKAGSHKYSCRDTSQGDRQAVKFNTGYGQEETRVVHKEMATQTYGSISNTSHPLVELASGLEQIIRSHLFVLVAREVRLDGSLPREAKILEL